MATTFPGITAIVRAEVVLTRGVLPGVHLVRIAPQDGLDLEPGTLAIADGIGGVLTLPDCLALAHSMRPVELRGGWVWELEVLDHRWRWASQSIGGEWNKRLPSGTLDPLTQRSPAELAAMCLDALGESGYDTSRLPASVYPHCDWRSNPGADLALKQVCDAVACEVCGGEFAKVTIWPAGQGPDLPAGGVPMHQEVAMVRPSPSSFRVLGGPKRYCSQLQLDPFGFEADNSVTGIENLSYRPASGWGSELPGVFAGLSAADRVLAKRSVWIVYEIAGQADGSLDVPTSDVEIADVSQYLPLLAEQIATDSYTDGLAFALRATVQGTFYAYGDVPQDEDADTLWLGGFVLDVERGRVTFPVSVFSLGSDQTPQAPTLTLLTSYHVTDEDGQLESLDVTGAGDGAGPPLLIRRPELYDAYDQTTSTAYSYGTSEANTYLGLFQAKYADNELQDQLYAGITAGIALSGLVAQITVLAAEFGDEGFSTRICRLEELAPLGPSQIERKRKEILRMIQEERGL